MDINGKGTTRPCFQNMIICINGSTGSEIFMYCVTWISKDFLVVGCSIGQTPCPLNAIK